MIILTGIVLATARQPAAADDLLPLVSPPPESTGWRPAKTPLPAAYLTPADPESFFGLSTAVDAETTVEPASASTLPPPPTEVAPAPLPLPDGNPPPLFDPLSMPIPEYEMHHSGHSNDCNCKSCEKWGPVRRFFFYSKLVSGDIGIGQERVAYAPFQIEQAEPYRNHRVRVDSAFGLTSPDRAEYFWAASGTGPAIPAGEIDYYDFRYISESGSDTISVTTDIPIRALDYTGVETAGLGNISMATKTKIVAGDDWFVSNIMRFYLPLGSKTHGTSNGHIALEPGLLARYRYNDRCYIHSQLKWWIPFGGDSNFNGQVLNYGVGMSYIWYESDAFAALPTLEFDGWSILSGQKTLPDGTVTAVGDDSFVNIMPGVRYVFGPAGDLGLFEFGTAASFKVGAEGWYEQMIRLELRWTY